MRTLLRFAAVAVSGWLIPASNAADPPKPNALTEQEIADGWINLFDGETTFGWTVDGEAKAVDGELVAGGAKPTRLTTTTILGPGKLRVIPRKQQDGEHEYKVRWPKDGEMSSSDKLAEYSLDWIKDVFPPAPVVISIPDGEKIAFASIRYMPYTSTPLFNSKDLTGWKVFDADPAKAKAKFEVTPAGELLVTGGPGDIRTDGKYADFVLQAQAKTNRPLVNSGFFFRCIPDQFQNGYEVQINNMIKDNDRTKPLDFGTGAIYRRVPARKVVSTDNEWFTLTVVANGPHIATWVNGYQTVDWTDDRKPDPNPRKGLRTEAGHISIQGHAPPTTADVTFRSIKIAELKAEKK